MKSRKTTFIERLKRITSIFPTSSEKEEISNSIHQIIEYLQLMDENIRRLPSTEDIQKLRQSLNDLEGRMDSHTGGRLLSSLIGSRKGRGLTGKEPSPLDINQGGKDLEELSNLALAELKRALGDEKAYPSRRIRAMLQVLGVRVPSKMVRSELAELAVTKISNYKGYEMLRSEKGGE